MLKITYFPARGTCDKIRLLLAEAQIPYTEHNVSGVEFALMKKTLPFGTLPILEDGNLCLFHSNAILRYLAEKTGLYGKTTQERIECDMWIEQCELIQQTLWNSEFMKLENNHFETKRVHELKSKAYKQELKPLLKECLHWLMKKNVPYLVGNSLTVADIFLFSVLDAISREFPAIFVDFPALEFYYSLISNRPRIRNFLNSRRI